MGVGTTTLRGGTVGPSRVTFCSALGGPATLPLGGRVGPDAFLLFGGRFCVGATLLPGGSASILFCVAFGDTPKPNAAGLSGGFGVGVFVFHNCSSPFFNPSSVSGIGVGVGVGVAHIEEVEKRAVPMQMRLVPVMLRIFMMI